jgi:glutamine synthetase
MMMGKQLNDFYSEVQKLMQSGIAKEDAILQIIKKYITESKSIRFEGDNYSNSWKEEAKSRGLNNFTTTPAALASYISEKSQSLFLESGVLSEEEIHAHYDVKLESYALNLQIESRILAELCLNQIIPAAVRYQTDLATNIRMLQDLQLDQNTFKAQLELVQSISQHIGSIKNLIEKMRDERAAANDLNTEQKANAYCDKVKPIMEEIRFHAEELEDLVDDSEWPLAKYRELLFLK